jgi:hypothetical protein
MAPKLPAKFDDISKTASSVLGDDFQCKDFQLKAKQKTNFVGATSDLTVDLFGKDACKTPTKLSFKLPKPFAYLDGFAIDKLDLAKDGKTAVDCSFSNALHKVDGLKLEVKTDLADSLTYHSTFTGVKDLALKFDTDHFKPTKKFTVEALYGIGSVVIGVKQSGMKSLIPNVGVNFQSGDIFASVLAKSELSEFTGHGFYKVSNDIKVATTYTRKFDKDGDTSTWAVGAAATINKETSAKAKFESSKVLSVALKRDLAKGTTVIGGVNYNIGSGAFGYGAKLSIE